MATEIAHCGACAQRMILIETADAWWYVCTNEDCGEQTPPRATAAEAAEDVVWVAAKRSRRQAAGNGATSG
jgi:hypothetical protein